MSCQCFYCQNPEVPQCQRCGEMAPALLYMSPDPQSDRWAAELCSRCYEQMEWYPSSDMKLLVELQPVKYVGGREFTSSI